MALTLQPMRGCPQHSGETGGAFHSTKNSRNSGFGSEWNRHFPGISFRNFGCTSRGWPKIPENRNNRKIPFHSTIPARAQFLRARKSNSIWLPILLLNISVPLVINYATDDLNVLLHHFCTGATANFRK